MALIEVRDLSFGYGRRAVLRHIGFGIEQGSLVSLLGPNGCGKTTLLKLLLGFMPARHGAVFFDGRPVRAYERRELACHMAYVPQVHRAAFAYRVRDVVLMGRMPHKGFLSTLSRHDEELADAALEKLGIAHLRTRPYTEISGGERQLALIARALCQGAHTFILDEPANGLDYGNQIKLLEQLVDLAGEGYTFVMSTHFPDHVLWVASQVVMLQGGALLAEGTPDAVVTRKNLCRLYSAEVDVWQLLENFKICVPERIRSRLCDCSRPFSGPSALEVG